MSFATRLIAKLEPWMTADLERYLKAAAKPYEQVEEIAEEVGTYGTPGWVPGYGKLLNPTECPYKYLPWLGQFVGVEVPTIMTEGEARETVKAESGLERGTRGSLEALLKKALGTKPFLILEREPTPYHLVVVIPVGSIPEAAYREINLTIPAGIWYEIIERAGTWYAGTKKWSAITAGKTWAEMTEGNY